MIDDFSKTMSNVEKSTKKLSDELGKVGAVASGAGLAIGAGLGMAVKTTADFESAMSRVGALSNSTDDELSLLTDTAKQLGAETAFSASQAAEGMSFLGMAGYKTNDIIAAMPGLLNAAAAGQTDLATTADITSNILSGFGLQASETARVADVLTKTFTSSNTDLAMLGETMKYVAPTAKAMGLSLEEVSAAAGILGNAGIQGSQAGTSLSMSLTRLASPAKEAALLMDSLGFNAFNAEGQMLPLNKIIENLQTSTADLTDEQRMHTISTIFGAESMKAMLTLMEAGPGTLRKFTGELENSGGVAETIAAKQLDNLNGQLTILKSGLEGAAISLGTALLPAVKWVATAVQGAVDWFNGLNEGTKRTIAIVAALTAAFLLIAGPALIAISFIPAIMTGFAALATAAAAAGPVIAGLMGPITLIVGGIALLVAGIIWAWNNVDGFRAGVQDAWAKIKEAFLVALEFVQGIVRALMADVTEFLGEQLATITAFWDEHGAKISELVKNYFTIIGAYIEMIMGYIKGVFEAVWPLISGIFVITWNVIKLTVENALDYILGLVEVIMALIEGDWEKAWESIKDIAKDIWENIEGFFEDVDLLQIGKDIIQGLIDGLGSMMGSVEKAVDKIAALIPDGVASFLGIRSPSRVMMEMGRDTGAGFIKGIGQMVGGVAKVSTALATQPMNAGRSAAGSVTNNSSQNITVNLEYHGDADPSNLRNMMNYIEAELGSRMQFKGRAQGIR
ncbi:phage tail tape measure protein [Bacillus tianshenii]|uniref:phage tail tape measure protein n=1 Tax=Sutcliffiella tianshenii TaxID=1463404 RepID=UPI001CD6A9B7|nr:phage tail tape measure protein [Bacillus tianshenii]MCA1319796.1 phage tail tape measure protein [Bacillus tianshenii]